MPAKTAPPAFESWGRYPKHRADVVPLYWTSDFPLPEPPPDTPQTPMLPVGMGRSYGDSCLLKITHDQLREDANNQLYGGWPMLLSGIKTLLETGETLTTPGSLRWQEGAKDQSPELVRS